MESAADHMVKLQKDMLTLTGAWPLAKTPLWEKMKYFFISFLIPFSVALTMLIQTYLDLDDIAKVASDMYINITFIDYVVKLLIFNHNKRNCLQALACLEQTIFVQNLNHKHTAFNIKMSRYVGLVFISLCIGTAIIFSIIPLLDVSPGYHFIFPIPYDVQNIVEYILLYLVQVAAIIIVPWNNVNLDMLPCVFMSMVSAQFKILRENLENFTQVEKINKNSARHDEDYYRKYDHIFRKRLNMYTDHHNDIIYFTKIFEDVFSSGMLTQILTSIIAITLTAFNIIVFPPSSSEFLPCMLYFGCMMNEIAVYCFFGNDVIIQSVKVGDGCYMSKWYNCSPAVKKHLFIIMERAKRPVKLRAGNFVDLSLSSFTAICRSSYSYVAVLRRVYEQ